MSGTHEATWSEFAAPSGLLVVCLMATERVVETDTQSRPRKGLPTIRDGLAILVGLCTRHAIVVAEIVPDLCSLAYLPVFSLV